MRNLLAFSSASYRYKRLFQRPVEAIDDLGSFPEKALQALYLLEIRNHYASYITENVGNDENLVPALKQDLVGFCGSWSIRCLCENPALQLAGVSFSDDAAYCGGDQDLARRD